MSTTSTIWVTLLISAWVLSARWAYRRSDCRRGYRWLDALLYAPLGLAAVWVGVVMTQGVFPGVLTGVQSLPALDPLGGGRAALAAALALMLCGLPVALGFWGWRQLLLSKR